MKRGSLSLGFALVTLASISCGSPFAGSCVYTSGGMVVHCVEFHESFVQSEVMTSCPSSANSGYSTSECPATNRIGRCQTSTLSNGVTLGQIVAYYPPDTATSAMADCSRSQSASETATFIAN
jgi:hypothetical protein